MNSSYVRSIKTSPYEAVFGQKPNMGGIGVFHATSSTSTDPIMSQCPQQDDIDDIIEKSDRTSSPDPSLAETPLINFSIHHGLHKTGKR